MYSICKPINKSDDGTIKITFEGTLLERVPEQKILNIWFTEDLPWDTHDNQLIANLSRVVGSICRMQHLYVPGVNRNYTTHNFTSRSTIASWFGEQLHLRTTIK